MPQKARELPLFRTEVAMIAASVPCSTTGFDILSEQQLGKPRGIESLDPNAAWAVHDDASATFDAAFDDRDRAEDGPRSLASPTAAA